MLLLGWVGIFVAHRPLLLAYGFDGTSGPAIPLIGALPLALRADAWHGVGFELANCYGFGVRKPVNELAATPGAIPAPYPDDAARDVNDAFEHGVNEVAPLAPAVHARSMAEMARRLLRGAVSTSRRSQFGRAAGEAEA